MSTNFEEYKAKMKENEMLALKACENTINATVTDMYKKIVERTPVGDPSLWKSPAPTGYVPGKLKASWSINFNNIQRDDKGQFASGTQITEAHGLSLSITNPGNQTVAISNNAIYAQRIEYGSWSTQAPAGMMRVTVSEYKTILEVNAAKYRIL
jgi:hypothetical protein